MLRSFTKVRVRDDWGEGGCSEVQFYNFFKRKKKRNPPSAPVAFVHHHSSLIFYVLPYIVVFFSRGGWGERGALCGSHEGPGSLSFEKRAIDCLKKVVFTLYTSVFFITQPSIYK